MNRKSQLTNIFLIVLLNFGFSAESFGKPMAEPMPAPNSFEACNSESIVEGEYLSYQNRSSSGPISYFEGPIATFKVVRHILGKPTGEKIDIIFDFHDMSPCLQPKEWKFSDDLMPEPHSKWLLLLKSDTLGTYRTYRGDFGRIPIGTQATEFLKKCERKF